MQATAAARAVSESKGAPFQIRGVMQTILCLRLLRPADREFHEQLLTKIAHAPDFYRDAPIILDVGVLGDEGIEEAGHLLERLRQHRLVPIGIQNGTKRWAESAGRLGLAVFSGGSPVPNGRSEEPAPPTAESASPRPSPIVTDEKAEAAAPAEAPAAGPGYRPTLVVRQPVRAGQQVVANDGDLTILAAVGAGAEVAATGNIHIYAPLRGRAFAGIDGDEKAMIFCDQLEAELVSIAGIHRVNEEIEQRLLGKRAYVTCKGQELELHPLS